MWSGDLGRAMKTDVIPALKNRMQQKLFENTCFNLSKRNILPGRTLQVKVSTRSITLAITKMNKNDNFDQWLPSGRADSSCFQLFFAFHFQTNKLHRILSVKPLIGNSKPQQSNWVFRFLAKKKMTNWGGRSDKMLPVFRYLKTVNFTIVPPMNNF